VDLADAASRAVSRWAEQAAASGASIRTSGVAAAAVANPADVDQILDAILDNAVSYAPGPIDIETAVVDGTSVLSVQDHGPGVAEHELERVTERFYRGRGVSAGGSGLGLSIATELAATTGGTIGLERPAEGGTRVVLRFPVAVDDGPIDAS
jgi:two-component system sensor histidine kinase TctE